MIPPPPAWAPCGGRPRTRGHLFRTTPPANPWWVAFLLVLTGPSGRHSGNGTRPGRCRSSAAIDAHEHTTLTGPAADEAARRLEAFGERARFQGTVVLDDSRPRRLMARHDPAVYPGEYINCVHDHTRALCEKARSQRSEGLPDHGGCKPLACRNVALTSDNTAAWQREIDRIDRRLVSPPALPPLLRHPLEGRRAEITPFLSTNTGNRASA